MLLRGVVSNSRFRWKFWSVRYMTNTTIATLQQLTVRPLPVRILTAQKFLHVSFILVDFRLTTNTTFVSTRLWNSVQSNLSWWVLWSYTIWRNRILIAQNFLHVSCILVDLRRSRLPCVVNQSLLLNVWYESIHASLFSSLRVAYWSCFCLLEFVCVAFKKSRLLKISTAVYCRALTPLLLHHLVTARLWNSVQPNLARIQSNEPRYSMEVFLVLCQKILRVVHFGRFVPFDD